MDANAAVSARVLACLGDRSQRWLAKGMGTTPATLSRLLAPTGMSWTADYIFRAAHALGVTPGDLLGGGAAEMSDDERLVVLVLRQRGWKGLIAEAVTRLQAP